MWFDGGANSLLTRLIHVESIITQHQRENQKMATKTKVKKTASKPAKTKICTMCKKRKKLDAFYVEQHCWCKDCNRKYAKKKRDEAKKKK